MKPARYTMPALLLGLSLIAACTDNAAPDDPDDPGDPEQCFPIPANAQMIAAPRGIAMDPANTQSLHVRVTTPGDPHGQGTTLQGDSPGFMQNQGESLQGHPPDWVSGQGTRLQGSSPSYMSQQGAQGHPTLDGVENQGTTLQDFMSQQGASLQGQSPNDIMSQQGTTLQGQSPNDIMSQQGTTLQGQNPNDIMSQQGTTLQGQNPNDIMSQQGTTLQGQSPNDIMSQQGITLQGASPNIMPLQGTKLQGHGATTNYMPNQGTSLQGQSPNDLMQGQGTTLQGASPNIMQLQGSTLQGASPNIMQIQGTSLQGASPNIMQLQGSTLQGASAVTSFVSNQGTSLQGSAPPVPGMQLQGTTLQGTAMGVPLKDRSPQGNGPPPPGTQLQGATLQGARTNVQGETEQGIRLQGAAPNIMQNQGTSLQGQDPNIMTQQGTTMQGTRREGGSQQRASQPRAYRGLADLNGAKLTLESDPTNAVTVQDGQLVARGFATTASLRGKSLAATAPDGRPFRIEILEVKVDGHAERTQIVVDGFPACQPDQQGVFIAGRFDAKASYVPETAVVTYSCMDGVIAKCVNWGYAPWLTDDEMHAACTRLARADYCGDGTPWTLDGTLINVFDRLGIQPEGTGGDMSFEAAWGPSGAVCVARTRYDIHDAKGKSLVPACFKTMPRCSSLDEVAPQGAMLANRSMTMPIDACK